MADIHEIRAVDLELGRMIGMEAAHIQRLLAEAGQPVSLAEAVSIIKAVQGGVAAQQPGIVARLAAIHRSERGRLGVTISYAAAVRDVENNLRKK